MLPQITLYQPSVVEIAKVTVSAVHRHPAFVARIEKAYDILVNGGLQLEPVAWAKCNLVRWRIQSQSNSGAYVVNGLHCPCQDSRAPMIGAGALRARFCKHSMAV